MTKRSQFKGAPIRNRRKSHSQLPALPKLQRSNYASGESRTCANLAALMNQTESWWITHARLEIPLPLISMPQLLKPQHLSNGLFQRRQSSNDVTKRDRIRIGSIRSRKSLSQLAALPKLQRSNYASEESRTCANLAALMNQTESWWITHARLEIPPPIN
ncbi:hypothetical protein CDAR_198011 [Caerostris darwini]|uniref:Uncharacterized protein n=1 Tax=Caerostris darwini TaxID=1538125 RepID=A0AAV4RHP2_9ARAC|nr:hypothetical protein CDAR_198011 [Caerostris darwini]